MGVGGPCEVPLLELLRRIPIDAVFKWNDEFAWCSSPVGRHCHEAAAEIERLRADKRRLDYLESEAIREIDLAEPYSLFRRNVPITRQAIDEALNEPEGT